VTGDYSRKEIVRRQLGVATQLFLDDMDPISVHCLASSAAENASLLAKSESVHTFNDHILTTFPHRLLKDIRKLRNQYWTPIKHASDQSGINFDLEEQFFGFSDVVNDHTLFVVWYDYCQANLPLPIEAQVFQVWYYAMYPEKLASSEASASSQRLFGNLADLSRDTKKQRLQIVAKQYRNDAQLLSDPKTDPRPLVLR
jgi:hypothetical protein